MAIIELPQLKNLTYLRSNNSMDYINYNKYISLQETQNFTLSSNEMLYNNTKIYNEIYYHKNFLGLLLIIMISFFILSYYLYYVSKYNIKKAKSNNTESSITFLKYTNLQNLSIATFRNILLI